MKNSSSVQKILVILTFIAGILFNTVAFAAQPQLILFCSNWNMKCRDARVASAQAAQDLGMKYTELDIDQPSSQQKATDLGINLPNSIPYIYILDNRGKLVIEKLYKGESAQALEQQIRSAR